MAIEANWGKELMIAWKPDRPIHVPVSILSITRARDALGWTPKAAFEDGLAETVRWWRER